MDADEELAQALDIHHKRKLAAARARIATDIKIPTLSHWNYTACRHHETPQADCAYRLCGGDLYAHQRVAISWLYLVQKGILADSTGVGKTNSVLGTLALMADRGEEVRAVVVCQPAAVAQWVREIVRWTDFIPQAAVGTRPVRRADYDRPWQILVIGYQTLLQDVDLLTDYGPTTIIADDVDPLRNPTQTHQAIMRLSAAAKRVYVLNATPLQTSPLDLWFTTQPLGGRDIFGSQPAFESHFVRMKQIVVKSKPRQLANGRWRPAQTIFKNVPAGPRNVRELAALALPLYLRRRYEDLHDAKIPEIAPPENVWLTLHPEQRKRYEKLQEGVLKMIKDGKAKISHVDAMQQVNRGAQICAGLPAFGEPDGPGASIKLDWICQKLAGDWAEEKIVVFVRNTGILAALSQRLQKRNIGVARIWGPERAIRDAQVQKFWEDPDCRVAIGTTAIERSLNLQNARIVVNLDVLLNPARMRQILGRVRRIGSQHSTVYSFNLLCSETQESGYMGVLASRDAVARAVLDDPADSDDAALFGKLGTADLLALITG